MKNINEQRECPYCQALGTLERFPRQWWMRLVPHSRYYRCFICDYRSFEWGGKQVVSRKS